MRGRAGRSRAERPLDARNVWLGVVAACACRKRFPKVSVGFITGWGDQLDLDQHEHYRVRFVLAKPFVASDVLRQAAEALRTAGAV